MAEQDDNPSGETSKTAIYVEDALIILALAALFVLGVFFREELWGQVGLGLVGLVMVVVFVRRIRRVHRAFTQGDNR